MIDLSKEQPMQVADVVNVFHVHRRTVEKWFKQGLEFTHLGGRIYTTREAIQRFSKPSYQTRPSAIPAGVADTTEAMRTLAAYGV